MTLNMKFKSLDVYDYGQLKRFFLNQPYTLSSYSLFSIIVWSSEILKTYYTIDDDVLIIFNEPKKRPEDRHLILPISLSSHITPHYLADLARKIDIKKYWFVPEGIIYNCEYKELERYFNIVRQPEFDDYVYLRDDLASIKGNRFARQRNHIHQFHKLYKKGDNIKVEEINSRNSSDCLDFLRKWCEQRGCDLDNDESLLCEKLATIKALENIEPLEAKGILVRIDGDVCAFGISSHLNSEMAILNFEKAFGNIKGLYQFLDNNCAKLLFSEYKYINKESDMNIPNLARSKKSYNPVFKIKSYSLTIK